ncbi:RNA polymerase sigma factor [Ferdinandcohnia quinoae]|uniref:RNA polymerase sigma factor n=1 Tax=Fredinandcohnia quinoae TaxID=2918902 RepID=A0AAW5ECL8_9BACI|nr:RNA polymerase sigma factor [Fredinandcohnia sp. SECRCQ15]
MDYSNKIEEWFYSYSDDIYNFLVYYTGSFDVDDYVQEVFLKAYKSLHLYEKRANPKTWLLTIARNVVIDNVRKNKLFRFLPIDYLTSRFAPKDDKSPEKVLMLDETLSEIHQAILTLKQSYKDVLVYRLILELSIEETATILDWTHAKVSLTYHRSIKILQKKLSNTHKGGRQNYEETTP